MMRLLPVLLFSTILPVMAGETDPPLEARLVVENSAITPGKPFRAGLHLVHPPGTHTYWKHPGIVGLPTTLKWELPEGFSAGEIQWPAPQVVEMGGHDAQGYEGEVLLMVPIMPPGELKVPEVTLKAKASWMYCGKSCKPANEVELSETVPVKADAVVDPATGPLFARFQKALPEAGLAGAATAVRKDGEIELFYARQEELVFSKKRTVFRFFTADGQVDTDQPQEAEYFAEGMWRIKMKASDAGPAGAASLPGVLSVSTAGVTRVFEVNPALRRQD